MNILPTLPVLLATTVLLAAGSSRAADSYDSCSGTIMSLPATLAAQGTWCLKSDLATSLASGAAINVTAHNVTIDCNGFKLGGLGAGDGTATSGVQALAVQNFRMRNCHVRGFRFGAHGTGPGFIVEDSRLEANTVRGILYSGDSSVVRDNMVMDTGGSSIGTGAAVAIDVQGDSDISGNIVTGVVARTGSGQGVWGIRVGDSAGGPAAVDVAGNRIRGLAGDGGGVVTAIRSAVTGRVAIRGNSLFGPGAGLGVQCTINNGIVRDNAFLGFAQAFSGCPNNGGNVVK